MSGPKHTLSFVVACMARHEALAPQDARQVADAFDHADRWVGRDALTFGLTAKDVACVALARLHGDLTPYGKLRVRDAEAARHAAVALGLLVRGPRLVDVGLAPVVAAPVFYVLRATEERFRSWLSEAQVCIREMRAGRTPREKGLTAAVRWAYDINAAPSAMDKAGRRAKAVQSNIARYVRGRGRACRPEDVDGMLLTTEAAGWEGLIEWGPEGPHLDPRAARDRIEAEAPRGDEIGAGKVTEPVPGDLESPKMRERRKERERHARHRARRRQREWHLRGLALVSRPEDAAAADRADAAEVRELSEALAAHRHRLEAEAQRHGSAHQAALAWRVDGLPIREAAVKHGVSKSQVEYAAHRWVVPQLDLIRRRLGPP